MKQNQSGIAMQYLQFWDNFNWDIYQKLNTKNNTFWTKFNWSLYIKIIKVKMDKFNN
jgi:hypothetical protein